MTPHSIPPKVARLIPMLGSAVDHEALSAARAIGRVLGRAGLAFTDLAAAIPGEGHDNVTTLPASGPTWDTEAWRYIRPSRRKKYTFTPAQSAEHRRMALWVRNAEAERLSDRERQFIRDIAHQRRELSIAQADWLSAICDRLAMEGRCAC